jgi:dolichol-phosphate mannosyltransferase
MKPIVLMPTYNEAKNIEQMLKSVLSITDLHILVIDDNSPDKTADLVKSLKVQNVDILLRNEKDGLGNAYKAGIEKILKNSDFTHLISMDADGSHRAEDLQRMLEIARQNPKSIILGSRWIPGGQIVNWPKSRKWLSMAGTKYAKWALKMDINDLTGGFRIYPRAALEKLDLNQITSNGYCYQIEMAFALRHLPEYKVIEVPITFVERAQGSSKMSQRIVLEAVLKVTWLGLRLRLNPTADKLHYVK